MTIHCTLLSLAALCLHLGGAQAASATDWNAQVEGWHREARQTGARDLAGLEAQARSGDPRATYLLFVELGKAGSPFRDSPGAQALGGWARQAADAGHPAGMRVLCHLYQVGQGGLARDEATALGWCERGARAGLAQAMNALAGMYLGAVGTPKAPDKAFQWYEQAARTGQADGLASLAWAYENGFGVPANPALALAWYQKAAQAGSPGGMRNLGLIYRDGRGITRDDAAAAQWLARAGQAGDAEAWRHLGWMHFDDQGRYPQVPRDDQKAFTAFEAAARAGDVSAGVTLGWLYERGRGTDKDVPKAMTWYEWAGRSGNSTGMVNLAIMYRDGPGGVEDHDLAYQWFSKAAAAGNTNGKSRQAWYLEQGRHGQPRDEAQALRLYREAADAGDGYSMLRLGVMLDEGRGVPRPQAAEAQAWLKKAEANGQERGVAQHQDAQRLKAFAQALVQVRARLARQLPGLPDRRTDTAELSGADSPQDLVAALRRAGSFEQACARGLVLRTACEDDATLAEQVREQSLGGLVNAGQLKAVHGVLYRQALQRVDDQAHARLVVQGAKAAVSISLKGQQAAPGPTVMDPSLRGLYLAQAGKAVGMLLMSGLLGADDGQATDAGQLLGPLIEDVVHGFARQFGPAAGQCLKGQAGAAAGAQGLSLEKLLVRGEPLAAMDRCIDDLLQRDGSAAFHYLARAAAPVAKAIFEVYGDQVKQRELAAWMPVAEFADTRFKPPRVAMSADQARTARGLRQDLSAQLQLGGGPLPEPYVLVADGVAHLLANNGPDGRAIGAVALAGLARYLAGEPLGIQEADAFIAQMNNEMHKLQQSAASVRLNLRQELVSGLFGRQRKVWVLTGFTVAAQ